MGGFVREGGGVVGLAGVSRCPSISTELAWSRDEEKVGLFWCGSDGNGGSVGNVMGSFVI